MANVTDIDVNECDSNPCLNNGTCTDLIRDYLFSCRAGFTGRNCETITELDKALMNLFHIFIITIVSMVSFSYVELQKKDLIIMKACFGEKILKIP
uniref:EGF-like domain-containing protein n=1 Tax=Tetranychus urticae TaxID=32264 RepID=T1L3V1_TETUR